MARNSLTSVATSAARSENATAECPAWSSTAASAAAIHSPVRSAPWPLVLVCRLKNRRRSWALADDTRCTTCPRAEKNTAIGNHAGPVGSITTSRRVPQPCRPRQRLRPRRGSALSAKPCAWRPSHRCRPVPAPCALAMPRSMPTRRLTLLISSPRGLRCHIHRLARGGDARKGHGPKGDTPNRGSHSCAATGPGLTDRSTSLIRGIRGRAGGDNQPDGVRLATAPAPSGAWARVEGVGRSALVPGPCADGQSR